MTTAAAVPSTKELSFAYMGTADQQDACNKLFTKFSEQYPEITLKAQGIPLATWADFATRWPPGWPAARCPI